MDSLYFGFCGLVCRKVRIYQETVGNHRKPPGNHPKRRRKPPRKPPWKYKRKLCERICLRHCLNQSQIAAAHITHRHKHKHTQTKKHIRCLRQKESKTPQGNKRQMACGRGLRAEGRGQITKAGDKPRALANSTDNRQRAATHLTPTHTHTHTQPHQMSGTKRR